MPKKSHKSNSSLGKTLINMASNSKKARIQPTQEGFVVVSIIYYFISFSIKLIWLLKVRKNRS